MDHISFGPDGLITSILSVRDRFAEEEEAAAAAAAAIAAAKAAAARAAVEEAEGRRGDDGPAV